VAAAKVAVAVAADHRRAVAGYIGDSSNGKCRQQATINREELGKQRK
jgi:hypothetical protein